MSSYVKKITDAIEAKIISTLPGFSKSRYIWSIENNNTKTNNKVFRVIPESAQSVEGTMRTLTIEQKITVFLTTSFVNRNGEDQALCDAIEELYSSLELITNEAMKKHFDFNRILNVVGVDISAPEIDNNNDIVSIGATYTILYRTE